MPDLKRGLKGNTERILIVMKSMNLIEVKYHRDLLAAIVNVRPYFGYLYLKEFPFNLKKLNSLSWLAELCLAINLIPLIRGDFFNNSLSHELDVQHLIDLIDWMVDSFNLSLFRKGFLHSCILVKHAIARILSELHKLLDYIVWLDCTDSSRVEFLKEEIQNHVQALLRALFSLQCSGHFCMWRFPSPLVDWEINTKEEYVIGVVGEIWGVNMSAMKMTSLEELEG